MAMSERRPIVHRQSNWILAHGQETKTKSQKKTSDPGRRAILNERPPARGDVTMGALSWPATGQEAQKLQALSHWMRDAICRGSAGVWWRASRR